MSYEKMPVLRPSKGLAFEAFRAGMPSDAFPHATYNPESGGPQFLTVDGLGSVVNKQRSHVQWDLRGLGATFVDDHPSSVPWNLRGLGQLSIPGVDAVLGQIEGQIDRVVTGIINRNWPVFETKLDKALNPVKTIMIISAAAAGIAATFSVLGYLKK